MKCPNCGEEMGEELKCEKCGTTIRPTQTQEKAKSFEPIQGENAGFRKTNKLLFVFLAIIVVIVALAVYYAVTMSRPRYIFDQKISEFINSEGENTNYNTLKTNVNLEISINSDEPEAQEIAEFLNDMKFSFSTELDKSTQEELVGLQLSKANETLLDANMKLEAESQNLYVNLGELFDKTILANMSELSDEAFEIADTSVVTFGQKISGKKAETILEKEVKNELKDEYFSAEKTTIEGENVTKNTLKLSAKEFMLVIRNVCKNLSQNEEFINCFEDGETLKADLQEMAEQLEDYDVEEEMDVILDVYTAGFTKKVKRVDISFEEDNSKVTMQLTKANDDEYTYELFGDDEKILEGKIKYKEENDDFMFEITVNADDTELVVKLSGNTTYDESLSDFDTSNAVKYEELTTEDVYTLFGNFMNSEFYKIIEGFSNSNASSLLMDNSDEEDGDNMFSNKSTNQSSNLEKNVVKTYHDDEIKFNIPDGFEIYSQDSEHYKLFEKEVDDDEIQVDVAVNYSTLQEYIEEVKDKAEYYKEEEYQNVEMSDIEELEVNGNKFKKIGITYEYELSEGDTMSFNEIYIAHEVDKDNLYIVEIDGANLISNHEIEEFLTLQK